MPRHNFLSRLYMQLTPFIQITGFIILCTFIVTAKYSKYEAYADSITAQDKAIAEQKEDMVSMKKDIGEINDTLNDFRVYWNVPKHPLPGFVPRPSATPGN